MYLLGLYLVLAVGVSFLCSILEAVFLSITPTSLAGIRHNRPAAGRLLTHLRANVDRPLAAILTLNTVAHTVGAAGVGAQAERVWGSSSLGVVSAVLTLLILVVSEIIPKTLGAVHWRSLAPGSAYIIQGLVWLTLPLVWMAQRITRTLARGAPGPTLNRDELAAVAEAGHIEGVFTAEETRMVQNLVKSWRQPVREILTPRTVVAALSADQSIRDCLGQLEERPFSRFPVFIGSIDRIQGYVLKDELLQAAAAGREDRKVSEFLRPIVHVPESKTVRSTSRLMLKRREHVAAVVDEFGGLAGIVTMEDVFETLLGEEIVDEVDDVVDMRAWAREAATERQQKGPHPEG